ncbi:MAG: nicotinamide-nucleotide amidohydrolase family protein [Bacteroidetes bacterium]|nr:nicotinamide-nucleotide amidohydrolase family protein [Bacteroidota bacterium]
MPSELLVKCSHLLKKRQLTIAFAESATAGRLSAELALIPDCGKVLKGGIVCYDACVKQDILGVPESLFTEYTPESAEVTEEMARRLRKLLKADIAVAVTGLTMPGGSEGPDKPVGTMFIHTIIHDKNIPLKEIFKGAPEDIVLQTVDRVARLLIDELER